MSIPPFKTITVRHANHLMSCRILLHDAEKRTGKYDVYSSDKYFNDAFGKDLIWLSLDSIDADYQDGLFLGYTMEQIMLLKSLATRIYEVAFPATSLN